MNDEIPDGIMPVIDGVASDMGRKYHRFGADREDMSQTCLLWIFDHPSKVIEYLDNEKYGIKQLARALRNECHDAGEQIKAQYLGYSLDDLYYYKKNEAKSLLDSMFDEEAWTEPPISEGGPTGRRDPATGGGWIAALADVSRGYAQLSNADKALLEGFHRDGWTNIMMAEYHDCTTQTMSARHDSAIKRLVDILGGPRPRPQHDEDCDHGWHGRHAMGNSQARAVTQGQYDED